MDIDKGVMLQMAVKAVNDTAGPDGLVPTLLVFGAYPQMVDLDPPAATITQCATAIKLAMKEVCCLHATRQVRDALWMRNVPRTQGLQGLPLNSNVLVWRENRGWTGPYKLLGMEGQQCSIDLPNGPTSFRSTVVKPYLAEEQQPGDPEDNIFNHKPDQNLEVVSSSEPEPV